MTATLIDFRTGRPIERTMPTSSPTTLADSPHDVERWRRAREVARRAVERTQRRLDAGILETGPNRGRPMTKARRAAMESDLLREQDALAWIEDELTRMRGTR